jgi:hypothetical protein
MLINIQEMFRNNEYDVYAILETHKRSFGTNRMAMPNWKESNYVFMWTLFINHVLTKCFYW